MYEKFLGSALHERKEIRRGPAGPLRSCRRTSGRLPIKSTGALVVTLLACGGLAMGPAFAGASAQAAKKLTLLQKGLNYYHGKTITYIVPSAAGSGVDIESRAMAQELSQYLGVTVNVVNISTGQTIPAQDQIAAAAPNGLTIGDFNISADYYDIVTDAPGPNFNVKNVTFLGSVPDGINILATQSNTAYTSFKTLLATTPSSPIKVLITPGIAATATQVVLRAFGINVDYIGGYANSSALTTGFLRGDGPLDATGEAQVLTEISAGTVRALYLDTTTTKPPIDMGDYSILKSVPTFPELLEKYPPKTAAEKKAAKYAIDLNSLPTYVFGAPASVPTYIVAALDAGVKFGIRSTYFKTRVLAIGNISGYINPRVDKKVYVNALTYAPGIEALINS